MKQGLTPPYRPDTGITIINSVFTFYLTTLPKYEKPF